jgi:hypothetical protein
MCRMCRQCRVCPKSRICRICRMCRQCRQCRVCRQCRMCRECRVRRQCRVCRVCRMCRVCRQCCLCRECRMCRMLLRNMSYVSHAPDVVDNDNDLRHPMTTTVLLLLLLLQAVSRKLYRLLRRTFAQWQPSSSASLSKVRCRGPADSSTSMAPAARGLCRQRLYITQQREPSTFNLATCTIHMQTHPMSPSSPYHTPSAPDCRS